MNTRAKFKKQSIHVLLLLTGAAILAFGMFNIHSRCRVTEGGVLGMTLLLQQWFGITPGISGIVMDTLCYLLGFKFLGKTFFKNAVLASFGFSIFYNVFEAIGPVLPDFSGSPLIAAVLGGLFVGVGVGIVVRQGGASGGDDALALLISKLTGCKIGRAYLATDLTVLLLSLSYIPVQRIFYSLITVTLSSFIIDRIHNFRPKTGEEPAQAS
ncbi:MAG: hypothetical protein EOM69_03200 [Clostridia bacterium]|nr:hypothetical protein [Clostridia bacterium]